MNHVFHRRFCPFETTGYTDRAVDIQGSTVVIREYDELKGLHGGGTWGAAFALAWVIACEEYLDQIRSSSVLELGCGTALAGILLLDQ